MHFTDFYGISINHTDDHTFDNCNPASQPLLIPTQHGCSTFRLRWWRLLLDIYGEYTQRRHKQNSTCPVITNLVKWHLSSEQRPLSWILAHFFILQEVGTNKQWTLQIRWCFSGFYGSIWILYVVNVWGCFSTAMNETKMTCTCHLSDHFPLPQFFVDPKPALKLFWRVLAQDQNIS